MTAPPTGFTLHAADGARAALRDACGAALLAAGVARPESLRERAVATYSGRGRPFAVEVAGVGRVFIRQYLHGGALRHVTGEQWSGDGRFASELATLVEAADAGVPVPEPLGYVSRPGHVGLRRGWLLTRDLPGARDVLAFLSSHPAAGERRAALVASGRAMRSLHDAGFEHPDLHLKNLLLASTGAVLVLDLDRARRIRALDDRRRLAGLFRFDRHADKQAALGAPVTRTDRMRVLRAYAGDRWPERATLRDLARRLARHIALHARRREAVRA